MASTHHTASSFGAGRNVGFATPLRSGMIGGSSFGSEQQQQQQQKQSSFSQSQHPTTSNHHQQQQDMYSSSSNFSFGGSPQQPITSFRQPEQPASSSSPSYVGANIPRQSSFRNLRRSTSGGGGGLNMGSGFGQTGQLDTNTPKTVRWEDAPEFPIAQQQHQHRTSSQYPVQSQFGSSFNSQNSHQSYASHQSSPFQQSQYPFSSQQAQQPIGQSSGNPSSISLNPSIGFGQSRPTMLGTSNNAYQLGNTTNATSFSYNQFGNNSNASQSNSSFALAPQTSSAQSQIGSTPAKSAFNSSLASLSRPLSVSTSPARATVSKAASMVKQATLTQTPLSNPDQNAFASKKVVITPKSAIVSRIKWNLAALILNWLVPTIHPVATSYWFLLSATLNVFGGDSDVQLASALSWLRNAFFVVLLINLAEACIRLQTYGDGNVTSSSGPSTSGGPVPRKPSLANPPNRIVSSSSANTTTVTNPSASLGRNTPKQYAQGSPLRDSILRASANANTFESASSPLGEGFRGPSDSARFQSSRKGSSSPAAAAFLARKQDRLMSGSGFPDSSFTSTGDYDDSADFSHDSIEVNRVIRALSASYQRELSQSLSNETGSGRGSVAV